ncbi:Molybdopterin converting factor, small subunit [Actinopolyspora xinjiangensis]|uniref:Molybdopterin converting factor, small subunit n=1 Tax=Actinopolyspora xinjiangensis TaxID=405564 RepID=A0A1H0TF86_9ACTN|nr:MoaD/ThiS family protein [Actinopolyspora xinjiangensis]SDP52495.1 Molybdopterin converting factor, small subunit [Actinopolyspora xinjiangensis]
MRITLVIPRMLRSTADGAGRLRLSLEERATLRQLLDELAISHPALERRLRDETRTLRRYVNFYVDGTECRALDGAATTLSDGAEVMIVPSVAGG